ncbi:MAG: exopolysaccharide transport family protein [Hyphomicrobiaceae bacterium]
MGMVDGQSDARAPIPVSNRRDMPLIRPAAVIEALWRRKLTILATMLAFAVLAGLIWAVLPRTYTSSTQILIDPRGLRVLDKDITPQAREADQSISVIESEMRFMASDLVLSQVIKSLSLQKSQAFLGSQAAAPSAAQSGLAAKIEDLRAALRNLLGRPETSALSPEQLALVALQKAIRVSRQPNTYVVDIEVKTKDRDLSVAIADSIAKEYVTARFTSRGKTSQRASEAITSRLEEMARQVRDADNAVERYKSSQDLVSSQGRLLTEQRMGELSTQLQVARAETVRAQARMSELQALRNAGDANDMTVEALQSPTLERLRSNYATVRQREASLSSQLLPSHPVMRQVRQEVQAARASIDAELDRIAGTVRANLERAKATEKALSGQLDEMKTRTLGESRAQIELRELERQAETARSLYQSFLTRSRELDEQRRIDPNSAVILANAEPARAPNGPGLLPLLAAASLGGLGLGAAAALRRDQRDPIIRSALQIEPLVGDQSLLTLPLKGRGRLSQLIRRGAAHDNDLAAKPGSPTAAASGRLLRHILSASPHKGPLVSVVTAAEADQGKSAVALNLAVAAARSGDAVLLIDADRHEQAATRAASAIEKPGLAEVINATTPFATAVIRRQDPPCDLLPAGKLAEFMPRRLKIERLGETLLSGFDAYDLVVIDAAVTGHDRLTKELSARAHAVVLVAAAGRGRKASLDEGAEWIATATPAPIHFVLVTDT